MRTWDTMLILCGTTVVSLIAGFIWLRYKQKRYPNFTETDRRLWGMHIVAVLLGLNVYFIAFSLPLNFHTTFVLPDESDAKKIERIIENEKENLEKLNQLRATVFISLLVTGMYMFMVGTFFGSLQRNREKELLANNPETKKPLGL